MKCIIATAAILAALVSTVPPTGAAYPKRADIERHGWRCIPGKGWWHYRYGWYPQPAPYCKRGRPQ